MSRYEEFYRQSVDAPEAFWAEQAKLIDWGAPAEQILDASQPPFARWFVGGTTNLCHNAVDRHLAERGDQAALIFVSTETGVEKSYSFKELHAEVQRTAASLIELGVGKGDRVLIYMPMIPEAAFAMLACARIGAVHCVVFGGFASGSLATRIEDAEPKVVVSADAGSRGGKVIAYKPLLDEAIRLSKHKPDAVLLTDRGLAPMDLAAGRDHLASELRREAPRCPGALHMAGVHRHQLHHLHQRHHRQAQGRAARRGRLRRGAGREHEAHLRWPARRNLLLDQRHRLGGGPQLHRLWPADRRHGDDHVRRPAHAGHRQATRRRHLVAPGREVQGDGDVQRADRGAGAQEARPGAAEEIRPVEPACAVPGRRAAGRADRALDQRRPGRADHRQLLADRIGLADDHHCQRRRGQGQQVRQPGRADVRLPHQDPSRVDGRRAHGGEREGRGRGRRPYAAGLHADHLERRCALRQHLLEERAGQDGLFDLRLGHSRRRRVLLHPGPHRRRDQRGGPPPGHARDRGEHLATPTWPKWRWSAWPTR
jgi:hypothetical protein